MWPGLSSGPRCGQPADLTPHLHLRGRFQPAGAGRAPPAGPYRQPAGAGRGPPGPYRQPALATCRLLLQSPPEPVFQPTGRLGGGQISFLSCCNPLVLCSFHSAFLIMDYYLLYIYMYEAALRPTYCFYIYLLFIYFKFMLFFYIF